jgi:hypothetical protein
MVAPTWLPNSLADRRADSLPASRRTWDATPRPIRSVCHLPALGGPDRGRSVYPVGYVNGVSSIDALRLWTPRRWGIAVIAGLVVAFLVALPTAVIPNPIFGRAIEVTWWSYPVVILSGILGGMLVATYIKEPGAEEIDKAAKLGGVGGFLAFFAVGCPVCNKLVLLALGTSGAMTWVAPGQPFLAVASVILMAWALRIRLRGMTWCTVPQASAASGSADSRA